MKKEAKIIFWIFTVIIIIDNLYWQWQVKLTTEPIVTPLGGITLNLIGDIILLLIWFWLLLKIYKKAFSKNYKSSEEQ